MIRTANINDAKQIANLYKIVYPNNSYYFKQYYDENFIKDLIANSNIRFSVAEIDGSIVGSSALIIHNGYGELAKLVIDPNYRGLGLARKLLEERIKLAKSLSIDILFAEGRGSSASSLANLWKRGFKPYGIIPFKYSTGGKQESLVIFSNKEPCGNIPEKFKIYNSVGSCPNKEQTTYYSNEYIEQITTTSLLDKDYILSSLLPLDTTYYIYTKIKYLGDYLPLDLPEIIPKSYRDLLKRLEKEALAHSNFGSTNL